MQATLLHSKTQIRKFIRPTSAPRCFSALDAQQSGMSACARLTFLGGTESLCNEHKMVRLMGSTGDAKGIKEMEGTGQRTDDFSVLCR